MGDTAIINYEFTSNASSKNIVPLILISFIENAFKHGVNPNQASKINIEINIKENNLTLNVSNNKVDNRNNNIDEGLGLKNTKERLELLYPDKHSLNITSENDKYSVKLDLIL